MAREWNLRFDGDQTQVVITDAPQSLREIILLVKEHSGNIASFLRGDLFPNTAWEGGISASDVAVLREAFVLKGTCNFEEEEQQVCLTRDEEVRQFFRVAPAPCAVWIHIREQIDANAVPRSSVEELVAKIEAAKVREAVTLDVGGTLRKVHVRTLDALPMVKALASFPRRPGDAIFLDASPAAVDVLLELARGRSQKYLDTLEPSLRHLALEYADYFGMEFRRVVGFDFKLTPIHPKNPSVVNHHAQVSADGKRVTQGLRQQWNMVFGDTLLPSSGRCYWETRVVRIPESDIRFMIGVVDKAIASAEIYIPQTNLGWCVYQNDGEVTLRQDNAKKAGPWDSFQIVASSHVGVLFDADLGSLSFYLDDECKVSFPTSLKGRELFPAISTYCDTVLEIKTGLLPPS